jgi:hypothetical protein
MRSEHQKRLDDFEQRAAYSPESVLQHRTCGWRYIPVHRLDEVFTSHAVAADCWCLLNGDAALLECMTAAVSPLAPGYYLRHDAEPPHWPKLVAVLSLPGVTRAAVEDAMQHFVALGFPGGTLFKISPNKTLTRLPDDHVA